MNGGISLWRNFDQNKSHQDHLEHHCLHLAESPIWKLDWSKAWASWSVQFCLCSSKFSVAADQYSEQNQMPCHNIPCHVLNITQLAWNTILFAVNHNSPRFLFPPCHTPSPSLPRPPPPPAILDHQLLLLHKSPQLPSSHYPAYHQLHHLQRGRGTNKDVDHYQPQQNTAFAKKIPSSTLEFLVIFWRRKYK